MENKLIKEVKGESWAIQIEKTPLGNYVIALTDPSGYDPAQIEGEQDFIQFMRYLKECARILGWKSERITII